MSDKINKTIVKFFKTKEPLVITLYTFLIVVLMARLIGFLVIDTGYLPRSLFLDIRGFRLHHFVYGNLIIVIMSFLQFVLGKQIPRRLGALTYGIGLGLVIDEFALWSGAIRYLSADSLQVINWINFTAVIVVTIAMVFLLYRKQKRRKEIPQEEPI